MAHNAPGHKRALNPRQLKGHYHRCDPTSLVLTLLSNLHRVLFIIWIIWSSYPNYSCLLSMLDLETPFQVVHCTCFHVFSIVLILCNLYRWFCKNMQNTRMGRSVCSFLRHNACTFEHLPASIVTYCSNWWASSMFLWCQNTVLNRNFLLRRLAHRSKKDQILHGAVSHCYFEGNWYN